MSNFTWTDSAVQSFAHVYAGLYSEDYLKENYLGKRMHEKLEQFKGDYSKLHGNHLVDVTDEVDVGADVSVTNMPKSITVTINL